MKSEKEIKAKLKSVTAAIESDNPSDDKFTLSAMKYILLWVLEK